MFTSVPREGVVVVMASHNSSRFVKRALRSIDVSMGNHPFALVVADDGSTDETIRIIRRHEGRARERIVVGFPKAGTVSEAKNRAVKLARPFFERYPWVFFMDDDDEMLPGRLALLARMVEQGQKAGVGDWIFGDTGHLRTGDWSIHTGQFGPSKTVIHSSLISSTGDYFAHVPPGVHEDMVTHRYLAESGVPWAYHVDVGPVHVYHQREDSVSGGPDKSEKMLQATHRFVDSLKGSLLRSTDGTSRIASFCTVAFGDAIPEAILLARSLRIAGNTQPLLILTDSAGEAVLRAAKVNDQTVLCEEISGWDELYFHDFKALHSGSALKPGAFLGKMEVMREALLSYPNTLYLDADTVVLQKYTDWIGAQVALSPELAGSCSFTPESRWQRERLGRYNGGTMFASRGCEALLDWWRTEFLATWRTYSSGVDDSPHGGFVDQSPLDTIAAYALSITSLHPGHNVMGSRLNPICVPGLDFTNARALLELSGLSVGHRIYWKGWPVVSIHCHFRSPNWHTHAAWFFRTLLALGQSETLVSITELVGKGPTI